MARGKRKIGMEAIDRQIEAAQADVISTKKKYDEATDRLKALLDKKKELQMEELLKAIMKSAHSYEEILGYINSPAEEVE